MVKIRQPPIPEVTYRSPPDAPEGLELMSFDRLRAMSSASWRSAPHRPDFHVLGLVEAGTGHHSVDFTRHDLRPGSALWIRPGQVRRFDGIEDLEGPLILFRESFLPPGTAQHAADDPFGPGSWMISEERRPLAEAAFAHLRAEYTGGAGEFQLEVLRHLLAVLIVRLIPDPSATPPVSETFARFRAAVERDFAHRRQVADYARELGYAPRTLARATLAATGLGAKEFIDRRVILEAKRLLTHGDMPTARCARHLGFDDAANFAKFFRHHTGATPGEMRRSATPGR